MATPASGGEHAYATLLLSDSYLPGALVLARSLRDAGTSKLLVVLVTLDCVSADSVTELQRVYDHVLPVPRIRNAQPANLYLMDRADLHSAFTKISLWKLVQYARLVYLDADVVAYRAPDELFDLPHAFAAAPDVGWPDLFNSGVMLLTPNLGDFYALLAMAERGISFDGADQGLLNTHFGPRHHRLPFTYNVTPSAHYQYLPAYRHFQSTISMIHFIGADKPWLVGRDVSRGGTTPYDEMAGRWWAVYDRHYRRPLQAPAGRGELPTRGDYVRHLVKGELLVSSRGPLADLSDGPSSANFDNSDGRTNPTYPSSSGIPGHIAHRHQTRQYDHSRASVDLAQDSWRPSTDHPSESWDAQRHPPPPGSKPEALNFPSVRYDMSQDTRPFVAPVRYPAPPIDLARHFSAEKAVPSTEPPPPIFPWEARRPTPTRAFSTERPNLTLQGPATKATASAAAGFDAEMSKSTKPTIKIVPSDPWTAYPRLNAWDDVPGIDRYVTRMRGHRRTRSWGTGGNTSAVLSPTGAAPPARDSRKPSILKLTDFPSEVERPSLPVTPAPIRRSSFWGEEFTGKGPIEETDRGRPAPLPAAEGVPVQAEWNPAEQLQKLAEQQSEALLRMLGDGGGGEAEPPAHPATPEVGPRGREIPPQALPPGSAAGRTATSTTGAQPEASDVPFAPRSATTAPATGDAGKLRG